MSFIEPEVEIAPPPPPEVADPPTPKVYRDYSVQIGQFQVQLARAEERRLHATDQNSGFKADSEVDQFRRAIKLYERAQYVEPRMRQFGTHRAKRISIRIPPKTMSNSTREDLHLVGDNYIVRTNDPRFIVMCLDMVEARTIPDFHEMKVGLSALWGVNGNFAGWMEPEIMLSMQDAGLARNW